MDLRRLCVLEGVGQGLLDDTVRIQLDARSERNRVPAHFKGGLEPACSNRFDQRCGWPAVAGASERWSRQRREANQAADAVRPMAWRALPSMARKAWWAAAAWRSSRLSP